MSEKKGEPSQGEEKHFWNMGFFFFVHTVSCPSPQCKLCFTRCYKRNGPLCAGREPYAVFTIGGVADKCCPTLQAVLALCYFPRPGPALSRQPCGDGHRLYFCCAAWWPPATCAHRALGMWLVQLRNKFLRFT